MAETDIRYAYRIVGCEHEYLYEIDPSQWVDKVPLESTFDIALKQSDATKYPIFTGRDTLTLNLTFVGSFRGDTRLTPNHINTLKYMKNQ